MVKPRKPYTPRPFAPLVEKHFTENPRCALYAGMGVGKTVLTLTYLDSLWFDCGDHRITLVVATTRVATDVWPSEAAEWAHLTRIKVVSVTGTQAERIAALNTPAQVYCINYENLPWLRKYLQEQKRKWFFRRVVADEATRLKGFRLQQGSRRALALGQVAWPTKGRPEHLVDEFIELTGTPSPNGLKDLWGQMYFIDRGQRLGLSYSAFEERYFAYKKITDAVTHRPGIQMIIQPGAQEYIMGAIRDVCLTIDPKDWFDLHEPIITPVWVELPPAARRHYKELEKEMFTVLKDGSEIEALHAGAKSMKCRQAASGALYLEDGVAWREIHDEKIKALEEIANEANGMPVLVSYYFKSDLARLQAAFPQARTYRTKKDEDDWNAGKVPMMFVHPKSAGHGLSLQHGGNIIAFFTADWNLEEHMQIIERIGPTRQAQSGYDRPVYIYLIMAKATVDVALRARVEGKKSVQDALLDYMNETEGH